MANSPASEATAVSNIGRRKKAIIFSNGKHWKIREGVIVFSTILSLFASTFLATFDTSKISLVVMLYICDGVYLAGTAVRIKDYFYARLKWKSCEKTVFYLCFPVAMDIISLLPIEIFTIAKVSSGRPWLHVSRLYRLNRTLRFYNLFTYFGALEEEPGAKISLIRLFKHTFMTFAALHLIACRWYSLGCEPSGIKDAICDPKGWVIAGNLRLGSGGERSYGLIDDIDAEEHYIDPEVHFLATGYHVIKLPLGGQIQDMSIFDRYLVCLYWSTVTATSTGYGDMHAISNREKLYSVLCMMAGVVFFFGTVLGDIGSSIRISDHKRAVYRHRLDAVIDYMHQKNTKKDLETVVCRFYDYMWGTNKAIAHKNVFQELPTAFQAELSLNVNKHILEKVPLFKDTHVDFKRMLSMRIKQTTYFPGQVLFREDEIGHSLYYVRQGEVQILKGAENEKPIKMFKEGSYFGEIALVMNAPRSASARAATYCDILSLDRKALNSVIHHFPDAYQILQSAIQERYKQAELSKDSKSSLYLKDVENSEEPTEESSKFWRMNCQKLYKKWSISPSSSLYFKWRAVVFLTSILFVVGHTSVASFKVSFNDIGYGDSTFLISIFAMCYFYDLILALDVLLVLRTEIDDSQKGMVTNPNEIRRFRIKTWKFWLDIASILPIEMLSVCFATKEQRWMAATFLKSNRLLRIYHIPQFFNMLDANIYSSTAISRPCKLILYIFLTTHFTSCVWFLQACTGASCAKPSWANTFGINETSSDFSNYVVSIYWSCSTMTSTGYGDITAMSRREEVFVLAVLIIGLLLYGYSVCSICSALIHLLAPRNCFMDRVRAVKKFLCQLNLPAKAISEVDAYLELVWQMHKGHSLPGTATLINDMPQALQENVSYEQVKDILQDVPIFKDTGERFQKIISLRAKTYLYTPGDTIAVTGDMSRDLYIVRRGQAEVLSADRTCIVAIFGPGGYFGEVGLLYGESRPSDVRAKTYCEVVVISKRDLDETLKSFPVIAKQLEHISENIAVLQRLQVTAREEARRSVASQENFRESEKAKSHKRPTSGCSKRDGRKLSLPLQFGLSYTNNEASITPEYRQERIQILEGEEQQEYYTKLHPILKILSKVLMKRSIAPDSQNLRIWTYTIALAAYGYLLLTCLCFTFSITSTSCRVICCTLDFIFLVDMYVKMHVGFYNEQGILVTCTLRVAGEYLKKNFLLDFIAFVPLDLALTQNNDVHNLARINRFLHFWKVAKFFSFYSTSIGRRSNVIRLIAMTSFLIFMMHFFACLWFFFACSSINGDYQYKAKHPHLFIMGNETVQEELVMKVKTGVAGTKLDIHHSHFKCGEESWAGRRKVIYIRREAVHLQYVASLYWAVSTLCSVGYGDIHAYLISEMILSAICMIFGVIYFGYLISYAFASLSSKSTLRFQFQDYLDGLKLFLKNQRVERDLEQRVLLHFDYVWERTHGFDMKNLFQGLPISMQGEIGISLYKSMLYSVPVFKNAPAGIIKLFARHMSPVYILNGEFIVKKGDKANEIYFINHGTAEIVTDDNEKTSVVREIGDGHFFGEISVICNSYVYSSIRTRSNVDLFVLNKKDLDIILNSYPHIKKDIKEIAHAFKAKMDEKDKAGVVGFDVQKFKEGTTTEIQDKKTRCKKYVHRNPSVVYKPSFANQMETSLTAITFTEYDVNEAGESADANGIQKKHEGVLATLKRWNSFVVRKDNPLRHIAIVNGIGVYLTYLTITFMASFHEYSVNFLAFSYIWEASFLFEIYLNFHMYYTLENMDVVEGYDMTFNHYLKGEFAFDLVANFPLELLCFAFPSGERMEKLCFLRLIHILRLRRVHKLFQKWLSRLHMNLFLVTLSENILETFVFIHAFSCIWYVIACSGLTCTGQSWIARIHTSTDLFSRYFDCIYWAVATMTSTGYGDIHATNAVEMLYCAIVMVAGKMIFGFLLGNVTSTLATAEAHRVNFEEKVKDVQAYMRARHIQPTLQSRVLDFFRASWLNNRGVDVNSLLVELPFCLRAEIYVSLIGGVVRNIPMFENCNEPFIRHLCCRAQYSHLCSGEFVTRYGDLDENLYIVKNGEVEGISQEVGAGEKSTKNAVVYKEGNFFGEKNVTSGAPAAIAMKAKTEVDLFVLTKSAVSNVVDMFRNDVDLANLNDTFFHCLPRVHDE